jgi:hypothetical protein
MMRSAGNFSPEWGYLAPAPSRLRTVRVVLVATAIGATAGAGVVLSLVDRPTGDADRVAVAAHAIVTSAQAAPAMESPKVSAAPVAVPAISPAAATAPAKTATAAPAQVTPSVTPSVTAAVAAPQAQAPQIQAPQVQAAPALAQPSNVSQQAASVQAPTTSDAGPAPTQPGAVAALSDSAPAAAAAQDAPAVTSDASAVDDGMGFVGPQQPKKKHHSAGGYKDGFPDISGPLRRLFNARNSSNAYYPNRAY